MPLVVVGAALLHGPAGARSVLAAQRARPPELDGLWELPGGKVEPGETEEQALVRECREELGVDVAVGSRLGRDLPTMGGRGVLHVYTGRVTAGRPQPREHRALRWLTGDTLYDVAWLPADLALLDDLRAALRA